MTYRLLILLSGRTRGNHFILHLITFLCMMKGSNRCVTQIIEQVSIKCLKLNQSKLLLWPITNDAIARKQCKQAITGFGFVPHWFRKWHNSCQAITEHCNTNYCTLTLNIEKCFLNYNKILESALIHVTKRVYSSSLSDWVRVTYISWWQMW